MPINNIYYQNVRGLRSKTASFKLSVMEGDWPIIAATETWLNSSVSNAELFPPHYNVFRRDRCERLTGKSRGGGVLLAAHNTIKVRQLANLQSEGENLWLRLEFPNKYSILLAVVYFPPNSPLHVYNAFFEKLDTYVLKSEKIIILGDFNLQVTGCHYDFSQGNEICKQLSFFVRTHNLESKNNVCNHLGKTLDLILTDIAYLNVSREECPVVNVDNHHPPLMISFQLHGCRNRDDVILNDNRSLNYKQADFLSLYKDFRDLDWSDLLACTDVNAAVDIFYNKIYVVLNQHVPCSKVVKSKYPSWYSKDLKALIKKKERLRRKYDKCKLPHVYDEYKQVRARIKSDIKAAYNVHVTRIQNNVHADPKSFWSVIKKLRVNENNSSAMTLNGSEVEGAKEITDAFANHFSSVYEPCTLDSDDLCRRALDAPVMDNVVYMTLTCVNEQEVLSALKKLKPKRSVGPDGIPPFVFKACADIFVVPLLHIFNISIKNQYFPQVWKLAKVVPIFKKGDKTDIKNYRPVAILSAPAKVFESILHNRLFSHIKQYISVNQHGFFSGRSINTNLVNFSEYCIPVIDDGGQVDVIYTDFASAFDKVTFLKLLKKLHYFGLSDALVKFFCSYLFGRMQHVTYNGVSSNRFLVTSGVPQGSILGPLLFLIFIDDIKYCIKNGQFLLYADDLKLFRFVNAVEDCRLIQSDIDRLYGWSLENLHFNVKKCLVMSYTKKVKPIQFNYLMGGIVLPVQSTYKDLGVCFDSKFSFTDHIISLCNKAFSILGFIRRASNIFKDVNILKMLYCSLVRSKLEFASIIWYPQHAYLVDMIEGVQKKALRFFYYKSFGHYTNLVPYAELLEMFEVSSLSARRQTAVLVYFHQLVHGVLDDASVLARLDIAVPRPNLRPRPLFTTRFSNTNLGDFAPLTLMVLLHNSMIKDDVDILLESQKQFRREVLNICLNKR